MNRMFDETVNGIEFGMDELGMENHNSSSSKSSTGYKHCCCCDEVIRIEGHHKGQCWDCWITSEHWE